MGIGTTTWHRFVFAQRVQRVAKVRNVKCISDQDDFTIEAKFCCAFAQNGEFSFVAEDCPSIEAFSVRYECFIFMEHDIGCSRVCATIVFTLDGVKDASSGRVELVLDKSADGGRSCFCRGDG